MALRWFGLVLLVGACTRELPSSPPPLVPTTPPATSSSARPAPVTRSFETKTIGGDRFPVSRAPSSATEAPPPTTEPARPDPWSPPPVYGYKNPSPPAPGTPLYGDLNPSPPGR